jgi:hypothetical protein
MKYLYQAKKWTVVCLEVLIFHLSTIFLLDFGTVLTVCFFMFFILFLARICSIFKVTDTYISCKFVINFKSLAPIADIELLFKYLKNKIFKLKHLMNEN